jgi:hypothetical protein
MRNIVLTVSSKENHQKNREKLYQLFKPKTPGTLLYKEDDIERQISYYVENVNIDSYKNCRTATISLLCADPYFESPSDIIVGIANWEKLFQFAFEIPNAGIEFGAKSSAKSSTIVNNCADYTGVEITITADNAVVNPVIHHIESEERIKVGTSVKKLSMATGDKVIITTHTNNKHVYFVKANGEKTEINGYLDLDSEFIQLRNGRNTFGYSADSGEENMSVTITFRYKYLGV